jgi:hypothetical protein
VVFERARITTEIEALRIYGIASGDSLMSATDGGWNKAIDAVLDIVDPQPRLDQEAANEAAAQANYERSWDDAFRNRTEDDE